jgi:hypothetical protein
MLLFTMLLFILVVLAIVAILIVGTGGIVFALVFGDLIICVFIIVMIVRHFINK